MQRSTRKRRQHLKNRTRRQSRQRGGGGGTVASSLLDWIAEIKKIHVNPLTLKDLAADAPIFPPLTLKTHNNYNSIEPDESFVIPALDITPSDIRHLIPTIVRIFETFRITINSTPEDFIQSITVAATNNDSQYQLNTLLVIENAIRQAGGLPTVSTLTDTAAFPLFIWYLFIQQQLNTTGEKPRLVPLLSTAPIEKPSVPI